MNNKRPKGIKIDLSRLEAKRTSYEQKKSSLDPNDKKNGSENQSYLK